jgi:hypothetical protein
MGVSSNHDFQGDRPMATAEPKGRIADFPVGFHAKIGRAKEHLDALKTSIAPFTAEGLDWYR